MKTPFQRIIESSDLLSTRKLSINEKFAAPKKSHRSDKVEFHSADIQNLNVHKLATNFFTKMISLGARRLYLPVMISTRKLRLLRTMPKFLLVFLEGESS